MRKDPLSLDAAAPAARSFDASQTLAPAAQQAIENARKLARESGNARMESVHLLLGALQIEPPNPQLNALLQISGLKAEEVRLYAQAARTQQPPTAPDSSLSPSVRAVMRLAGREARHNDSARVDASHIFIACFRPQSDGELAEVLAPLGVSADRLSAHLRQLKRSETARAIQRESPLAQLTAHGERALDAAHTAMRAQFCGRISTLHLLLGVLENPDSDAVAALQTLMIDVGELKQRADAVAAGDGEIAGPSRRFTPAAKRALDRAKAAAREGGRTHIGSGDLLMGLLPQPTLLIECAQFGARPDDPAAGVLREVDADLVRAIFNPQTAATPPAMAPAPSVKPRKKISRVPFWLPFGIQIMLGASLQNAAGRSLQTRVLAAAILSLIIVAGLGAAIAQLNPKVARFKTSSLLFFAGALLGAMAAMYLAR